MNFVSFFGFLVAVLLVVSVNSDRVKRAVVGNRWPTNKLPYKFDQSLTSETARQKIRSGLREMERLLAVDGTKCIEFNEIDEHQKESYILFENKLDICFGYVGYAANKPCVLNLADGCLEPNTIMHEVVHLLGFSHEQSRYDRDQHVVTHYDNIDPGIDVQNFNAHVYSNNNKSQGVPYDFFSISHYPSSMFAIDSAQLALESKFPSLMNKNRIDKAKTLSPLDILQIQRLYKCREAPAPSIRGSARFGEDKLGKVVLRFLLEAAATKGFNMSVAELYLERTLDTCGLTYFWPLNYPLIDDDVDEYYSRVCVEKRALNESCQFSIECESGECHEGKCSMRSRLEAVRLDNYYAGPLKVASLGKCYAECMLDVPCEAASFSFSSQSCYLFKGNYFHGHIDPDFVSTGVTDESLLKKISYFVLEGFRLAKDYKALRKITSPFECFRACKEDASCFATSFSESDGLKCLLLLRDDLRAHRDTRYTTYFTQLPFIHILDLKAFTSI